MRAKKFLSGTVATVLATAMAVTPVFAENVTGSSLNTNANEYTQEGDTTYVDTIVYSVTLPTDKALTFNLDPEGLLGYFVESSGAGAKSGADTATAGALTDYAGKIVGTGSVEVTNESSVPVTVTAEYYLDSTAASGITVKSAKDSTWDDSSKMMLLEVAASQMSAASTGAVTLGSYRAAAVETPATAGSIASIATSAAMNTTYSAFAIDSTDKTAPTKLVFGLDKAGYQFTYAASNAAFGFERDENAKLEDKNSAVFSLTGFVAKDADWKDQTTTKVKLNCVYTLASYKSLGDGNVTGNNLVIDQSKLEALGGDTVVVVKDGDTITASVGDTTLSFKVQLPTGATSVSQVNFENGSIYKGTVSSTGADVTVSGAVLEAFTKKAATYKAYIAFNGSTEIYTVTFTVS